MWLADVSGTRVLTDPLLTGTFHDGVFRVHPARSIDLAALRPDLIVVSHRHPDHFDVPSLKMLACSDPTTLVLTADPFVGKTCQELGFEHVGVLNPWDKVPLEGATLLTTPSLCDVVEWGMVFATNDGTVWNQVDTVLRDGPTVRSVWDRVSTTLGCASEPSMLIAQWQPLREIEPHVYGRVDFPVTALAKALERCSVLASDLLVLGASGHHHIGPASWLNAHAYPVSEARFVRDLALRSPSLRCDVVVPGRMWHVAGGAVTRVGENHPAVSLQTTPDGRAWRPDGIPPLVGTGSEDDRALVHAWVEQVLSAAIQPRLQSHLTAVLQLEVVWPEHEDTWSWTSDSPVATRSSVSEWDVRERVAGGALARVLRGESPWGAALLSGQLRRVTRPSADGTSPTGRSFFLYDALSYDRSFERWTAHLVAQG